LNNADGELSNEDAFILRDSGFVQQGKFTRTAKSAARSSLCFLPPVICDVSFNEKWYIF
jgi:hypothetical protein